MNTLYTAMQAKKWFQFMSRFSLLFHGILSCVIIFIIELCSRHSLLSALSFVVGSPLTFLYNALIIFASLLFVYLFKSRVLVRLVISVFWILLGVINGIVLACRVTPFNFTDLKLINDLLDMKDSQYVSAGQIVLIVIALIALAVFLFFTAKNGPKFSGKIHWIRNLVGLAACIAVIPFITNIAVSANVLSGYFGNLAQGYKDYGFVYSFSSSVVNTGMDEPEDYAEETIEAIADAVEDEETTVSADEAPNIIMVQLESFIDPYEISYLSYSEDPIPNFRKLMEEYTSGYVTVPVVGAGTCNTEFEVLTGLGIQYFGLGEYPYKTILKTADVESCADALHEIGYNTSVIHNNGGNFYTRAAIFNSMGFDSFVTKEVMDITEYNEMESWPKDGILVEETETVLDDSKDQADFIYTITVQSHGSYPDYEVFTNDDKITVSGAATEEEMYQWEYFVNELKQVDDYIGELLEMLEERDEDTIVILFGDHLPTMGLEDEDMNNGSVYETTYATWNNFGLEKEDVDLYSYQLFAYFTDLLGIHEGTVFTYHQSEMDAGTTEDASYLDDLELLQYDMLYGEQYVYDGDYPYTDTCMTIGVREVVIDDILEYKQEEEGDPDQIRLMGENFTAWSVVYVNGQAVDTEYLSSGCLLINKKALSDGCTITVKQVGSSDTVFRVSNDYIVTNADSLTGTAQEQTNSNLYEELQETNGNDTNSDEDSADYFEDPESEE